MLFLRFLSHAHIIFNNQIKNQNHKIFDISKHKV